MFALRLFELLIYPQTCLFIIDITKRKTKYIWCSEKEQFKKKIVGQHLARGKRKRKKQKKIHKLFFSSWYLLLFSYFFFFFFCKKKSFRLDRVFRLELKNWEIFTVGSVGAGELQKKCGSHWSEQRKCGRFWPGESKLGWWRGGQNENICLMQIHGGSYCLSGWNICFK